MSRAAAYLGAFSLLLAGCGYHVAGSADVLPSDIHTIAVTPWTTFGIQYKLPNRITASISRELISRTRYKVVADPAKADAVLTGAVANMFSNAAVADPVTGRSTGGQVTVRIQVKLTDKTGKVLFNQPNMEFHERYELSIDPGQYFDESEPALDRLSSDVARSVVSAILENF